MKKKSIQWRDQEKIIAHNEAPFWKTVSFQADMDKIYLEF